MSCVGPILFGLSRDIERSSIQHSWAMFSMVIGVLVIAI